MIKKYKSLILYGFFGVATTLVNIISYYICSKWLHLNVLIGTSISWLVAVIFAYITNKIFVFESKTTKFNDTLREIISFFSCRILTGILDIGIMYICVDCLHFNDMIIKALSNILVIILNYIASKLLIFNKKDTPGIKKSHWKEILIFIIIFGLSVLFMMNSPLNILKRGESLVDSSVFRFMGMMITKGYTPYLNLFDHKGPLLYLINALGYVIDNISGIWFIEVFFMLFSFYFIYKTAKLKTNSFLSLIVLLFTTINLFTYFEAGNLTEEYALLFIMISLYIFVDYLLNDKVNRLRIIICGFCFASVCLLRINMIPCWIVFMIAILIKCLKNKEYQKLINYIIYFLLGSLIITVPIFIWLISKGAFMAFIDDYITFNLRYSSSGMIDKWNCLFTFTNNVIVIIAIITNVYAIIKEKKKTIYITNLAFILLTLIMISISGRVFLHYGMILIPTLIIPFTYFVNLLLKGKEVGIVIMIYLISQLILPTWLNTLSMTGSLYHEAKNKNSLEDSMAMIKNIIDSNSSYDDKITVYGNWDYIYLVTNRLSASKYSYQFPIGDVNPTILDEYFEDLTDNNPKIIVISKGLYSDRMKTFMTSYHYVNIYDKDDVLIFKLDSN